MLFPYTHVPQLMDLMQDYIDFIFFKVWCKAEAGVDYDIAVLFADYEELEEIITELYYNPKKGADFFMTGLQQVFEDFKTLSNAEIDQLKHWYYSNNRIDLACCCDPSVSPATYDDIKDISEDLSIHLKAFFKNLYSQSFLSLRTIKDRMGNIEGHYDAFMSQNVRGKCPFCGLADMKSANLSTRDAYDHYLPKSKYPFNSINFKNLVPACHSCNSAYKTTKDPLNAVQSVAGVNVYTRRKSLYPFRKNTVAIELSISIHVADWTKISSEDIDIQTGPHQLREELDTWLDVYGIDERYKNKCCGEDDGMYWIWQILDEFENKNILPQDVFDRIKRHANNSPFADTNFLKAPFLQACFDKGIFDGMSAVEN